MIDDLLSSFCTDKRRYALALEVSNSGSGNGLAFIKRGGLALEEGASLAAQLQVITLGPGLQSDGRQDAGAHAIFSLIQQYTRHSFAPLIKSFMEAGARGPVSTHHHHDGFTTVVLREGCACVSDTLMPLCRLMAMIVRRPVVMSILA